jgi:hypothetical protein
LLWVTAVRRPRATGLYSRKIVGWQVADHLWTGLALDALEMALFARRPSALPVCLTTWSGWSKIVAKAVVGLPAGEGRQPRTLSTDCWNVRIDRMDVVAAMEPAPLERDDLTRSAGDPAEGRAAIEPAPLERDDLGLRNTGRADSRCRNGARPFGADDRGTHLDSMPLTVS